MTSKRRNESNVKTTGTAAFTLVEILLVSAIFLMVIGALLTVQLFGMKSYNLSTTHLRAVTGAEKALNQIRDQIRDAQLVLVGNYSGAISMTNAFPTLNGTNAQVGNALLTSNGTSYYIYYRDASTNQLIAYNKLNNSRQVLASYVTNANVFDAESVSGIILTNNQNNRAIGVLLQFSQWEFYSGSSGQNGFFQVQTLATER
jgi:type II secretory pathway pseudopilin PulG